MSERTMTFCNGEQETLNIEKSKVVEFACEGLAGAQ